MLDISIIVPLFNEEESLPELASWIKKVMDEKSFTYEVIMINDGSDDTSWEVVEKLSKENANIKGVSFQRNYGKSAALNVGFELAKGDVVITMDADLQDSPDEVPELFRMIKEEGFDLVSGWKKKRHDPISKTIPTKLYNGVTRKLTNIKLHDMNCGLKAYRKEVVKSVEVYGEMHRYIPVLAKQAGYKKIGEKVVQHQARKFGVTKFGLDRFYKGFLDLFSVLFITKFSKRPMHFFGLWGLIMFMVGFTTAAAIGAYKLYCLSQPELDAPLVTSSPYFYISLTSMILGTQLFLAGFIAELVSRTSTDRNKYLVASRINID